MLILNYRNVRDVIERGQMRLKWAKWYVYIVVLEMENALTQQTRQTGTGQYIYPDLAPDMARNNIAEQHEFASCTKADI
jgi:hypothetical protein